MEPVIPGHSQLLVGEEVTLEGEIQIVFQPELFAEFNNYVPEIGQTFDFIVSQGGIIADLANITITNFVIVEGASQLSGLTLSPFDSGFDPEIDPDDLLQIAETLFSFELVENNTILRATLLSDLGVAVPEPSSTALLLFGAVVSIMRRPHQRTLHRRVGADP